MIDNSYEYQALPKKRMASSALFLNEEGKILIVKPTYRRDWLLPGGVVEEYESPHEACAREIREELSLDILLGRLLCVEYLSQEREQTECVQFSFSGGMLSETQIKDIQLPSDELSDYLFSPFEDAVRLLSPMLSKRLPYCLQALYENLTVYLEDGQRRC